MSDSITVTGNVATTPEFKVTASGLAIATFRLASAQRRFDRAGGTWVDDGTNWYSVSVFRSLAEHTITSVAKGHPVIVTGRLRLREWDNGTKKGTSIEIDAETLGHDLRWGASSFAKQSGEHKAAAPAADPGVAVSDQGQEAWAVSADDEPPLALAGAIATPF